MLHDLRLREEALMCGIAGFSGRFGPAILGAMSAAIAHRGPDGDGCFTLMSQGIGLAHRRLAIIDLSPTGSQPMTDTASGVTIVYNGEIYNYRELRGELEAAGFSFRGTSDTEVVLKLYVAHGDAMLSRLNGIFALAIWDARDHSLTLARDGAGVKPLYVAETLSGVLFASEIKALLAYPELDRAIDVAAVWSHLSYLWAPTPHTMLKGVRKLEPGHLLRIKYGKVVHKRCFYQLPYPSPQFRGNADDASYALRGALTTAVGRQMIADVEVGAFLSGGLDSSAVVALARQFAPNGKVTCFTIETEHSIADEGFVDDLPYAESVAAHLGVNLNRVRVGPELAYRFQDMIWHLDEPEADLAPLNVLLICELARSHGIKVLLSGAGGDDILAGYRRHFALTRERSWRWLPTPARTVIGAIARRLPVSHATTRRVRKGLTNAALNGDERLISYLHWLPPAEAALLLSASAASEVADFSPSVPLHQSLECISAEREPLNRMLYLEAKHFLADHNLNYTDKMGMATGVEVRVPFLDRDLVSLAASFPPSLKQRGAEGKWILKRAMEGILPRKVIYRPKTGFGVPLRRWLRHELKPFVEDVLSDSNIARRGLFDAKAVAALRKADAAGRVDAAYPILALCSIETWCQLFIDRRPATYTEELKHAPVAAES